MSLTGGSLLQVMQGKRVYQPIWQILSVNINQSQSGPVSTNLLVSDGELQYLSGNQIVIC